MVLQGIYFLFSRDVSANGGPRPALSSNMGLENSGFGENFLRYGVMCHRALLRALPKRATRLWLSKLMGSHFGVGEFTAHFRLYFSGDWDVHWGTNTEPPIPTPGLLIWLSYNVLILHRMKTPYSQLSPLEYMNQQFSPLSWARVQACFAARRCSTQRSPLRL